MALFCNAASEYIRWSNPSGMQNSFTWAGWLIRPASIYQAVCANIGSTYRDFYIAGTATQLELILERGTTNLVYTTNTGVFTGGAWQFVAVTFDSSRSANDLARIYVGDINTPCVEVGLSSTTDGSGTFLDPSGQDFDLGNPWDALSSDRTTSVFQQYSSALTIEELRQIQNRPFLQVGNTCVVIADLDHYGKSPVDVSGNGVTITLGGSANIDVVDNIPLAPPFGFDVGLPYAVAAGATLSISENETINITEAITPAMPLAGVSVAEILNLTESLEPGIPIDPSQFENITVAEFLSILENLSPDIAEDITLSEVISSFMDLAGIDTAQQIGISEFVNLSTTGNLTFSASENVSIAEAISLIFDRFNISTEQTISIVESVLMIMESTGINVSDTIDISEYISAIMATGIVSQSEVINLSEAITLILSSAGVDIYEQINISESISAILDVTGINVSQQISISEYVSVTTITVAGLLKIAYSASRPGVNFTASKPKFTFTGGN